MWVEPDVLKDGADVSRSAGKIVLSGADALSRSAGGHRPASRHRRTAVSATDKSGRLQAEIDRLAEGLGIEPIDVGLGMRRDDDLYVFVDDDGTYHYRYYVWCASRPRNFVSGESRRMLPSFPISANLCECT